MKLTCEPFRPEHLAELGRTERVERAGYTLRRNGRVLACGGALPAPGGGFHLWSVIAPGAPMVAVTRAVMRAIQTFGPGPLVATTAAGFSEGCRWLELMGFRRDRIEPAYADGVDHIVYIREALP